VEGTPSQYLNNDSIRQQAHSSAHRHATCCGIYKREKIR
jgi:hypothetical protein